MFLCVSLHKRIPAFVSIKEFYYSQFSRIKIFDTSNFLSAEARHRREPFFGGAPAHTSTSMTSKFESITEFSFYLDSSMRLLFCYFEKIFANGIFAFVGWRKQMRRGKLVHSFHSVNQHLWVWPRSDFECGWSVSDALIKEKKKEKTGEIIFNIFRTYLL